MCARPQVVRDVVVQHAVKALGVHHDHVIEALASDRADDALHVGVPQHAIDGRQAETRATRSVHDGELVSERDDFQVQGNP